MQIIVLVSVAYAGVIQSAGSNIVVRRAVDDITEYPEVSFDKREDDVPEYPEVVFDKREDDIPEVSFDKREDEEPVRKVKGIPGNFAY